MTDHFRKVVSGQKPSLAVSKFFFNKELYFIIFGSYKEIFCSFQDFQGPRNQFKNFPGSGNFFPNSRTFQGFQEAWQPCLYNDKSKEIKNIRSRKLRQIQRAEGQKIYHFFSMHNVKSFFLKNYQQKKALLFLPHR